MIIDDQRRLAQKGRIRLGQKKTTSTGKSYPAKLETFRLTSPDRRVIDTAAQVYGGTAGPWEGQFEVVTDATDMAIAIIPAVMEFDSHYENWSGGVCRSRCNGAYDNQREVACDCDPDNRTCKSTTRMQLLLLDLPYLGTWRLETHGHYARVELNGVVDIVRMAGNAAAAIPARLRLEGRSVKRLVGEKVESRNFVVPVIDLDISARQLLSINGGGGGPPAVVGAGGAVPDPPVGDIQGAPPLSALPAGETPAGQMTSPAPTKPSTWRAVDQTALAPAPFVSVADQLDEVKKTPKPRKNAAAPIKPTGVAPRKASDTLCHLCGEPYGEGALRKNPAYPAEGTKFVHVACAAQMETPAEPAPAGTGEEGGGGGTASGRTPAGPAPAAAGRAMSHSQHKKLMAVTAEAFPATGDVHAGPPLDALRRERTIAIAAQLGHVITSRTELTVQSGGAVIDAMVGIRDGAYNWHNDRLVDADTGELVGAS